MSFQSSLWRRRRSFLSHLRIRYQYGRHQESRLIVTLHSSGAIPLFARDSAFRATAALPCRADHGEWPLHTKWEGGLERQVAKEHVQVHRCHGLHCTQLGWRKGPRQIRCVRGKFRLVRCRAPGENGQPQLTIAPPCSVPLCYVYPAMLHYKACARTWKEKAADIALGVFGVVAAIYTTTQTLYVSMINFYFKCRSSDTIVDSSWLNRWLHLHPLGNVEFEVFRFSGCLNVWVNKFCERRITLKTQLC